MLQGVQKGGEIKQSHGFLHKIKQQNEVCFKQRRINDWQIHCNFIYNRPRCCNDLM